MPTTTAKLAFGGNQTIDEHVLASLLHKNGILRAHEDFFTGIADSFDELEVSLRNLGRERGYFTVPCLAQLALVVRAVAESGRRARVLLPRDFQGQRTSLQWLLAHLGFRELFDGREGWQRQVDVVGDAPPIRADDVPGESHYVAFHWFDSSWFNVPREASDLFVVVPRLHSTVAKRLAELLLARGFLEPDAVDLFVRVMFLELGWNTVLHSQKRPGTGRGIVGAQIRPGAGATAAGRGPTAKGTTLHFCIADTGLGIPHTLREYYQSSGKSYEAEYGCSTPTAILRSAIDPESTSRQVFPDEVYRSSDRGLARVADAARPSERLEFGTFALSSGVGRITLRGHGVLVKLAVDDAYTHSPIPGVLVSAELTLRRPTTASIKRNHLREITKPTVIASAAVLSEEFRLRATGQPTGVWIVDVGYSDVDIRDLEEIARQSSSIFPNAFVILWNVRSQLNQLGSLATSKAAVASRRLAIVRTAQEVGLIVPQTNFEQSLSPVRALVSEPVRESPLGFHTSSLDPEHYAALTALVNTHYLAEGFRKEGPDAGFFVGRIQLLSGTIVNQYFSLSRNAATDRGLRRWTTSCAAALHAVLAEANVPNSEIVVLGLPGSVKQVLQSTWEHHHDLPRVAVHALMTYDVPTSDEIEDIVEGFSSVVFVTDVVSSASLLTEARRIVQKLRKQILGVIALVDARPDRRPDPIPGVRFVATAEMHVEQATPAVLGPEYWVDPVSLVPTDKRIFGQAIDPRVEETLSVLADTNAVRCGHIVDGQRHMSTYVDVASLIDSKAPWLTERIRAECVKRLEARGWESFQPRHMFYPSGIARIEAIHPADEAREAGVVSYRTGVSGYLPLLRELWPIAEPVPVPRAFDPAGRPRCARVLEAPGTEGAITRDVIVADDCLWTGRSAEQLVTLAVSLGASRVLAVPMLARLAHDELEHWESLRTVTLNSGATADVCYVFPTVLPIPQYGIDDCPYEITESRLRRWSGRFPVLDAEERRARSELVRRPPHRVPIKSAEYTATWLRLRAYAELAGVDENALTSLVSALRRPHRSESRLALLTLFLEEWNITGRARLRQTVRPLLRDIAAQVLSDDKASSREVIAACSLLRSIYPEQFVESLPGAVERVGADIDILGRLVLQIASLSPQLRGHRHVRDGLRRLTARADRFEFDGTDPVASFERVAGLLTLCEQLQLPTIVAPPAVMTAREAAAALFERLTTDATLNHDAWPWLQVIANSDNPSSYTPQTLRMMYDRWTMAHLPVITNEILPLVVALEDQLLLTMGRASRLASPDTDYFTDVASSTSQFVSDISGFSFALRTLAGQRGGAGFLKLLRTSAQHLSEKALSKTSVLVSVLRGMQGPTLRHFLDSMRTEVQATVNPGAPLTVALERHDSGLDDRHLFGSAEVIHSAAMTVIDNLRHYAFSEHATPAPAVLIEVLPLQDHAEQGITIRVFDNGHPLNPGSRPSETSRRASVDLERFDGRLHAPSMSERHGWLVTQQIDFVIW